LRKTERLLPGFREPEIEDPLPLAVGDEDVLRLQVAVDDANLVSRDQALCNLHRVVDCQANRQRPVLHPRRSPGPDPSL
jgi:hypothetical protein